MHALRKELYIIKWLILDSEILLLLHVAHDFVLEVVLWLIKFQKWKRFILGSMNIFIELNGFQLLFVLMSLEVIAIRR